MNPAVAQEIAAGSQEAHAAAGQFDAGEVIINHVANSSHDHPLIHLPTIYGIDFSVTKHVFMIWIVAAFLFAIITWTVRRYLRQERLVPSGLMNALEAVVVFTRDTIVLPNVGSKWVLAWTPLVLTLFVFILGANMMGLIPIFDALALVDRYILRLPEDAFFARVVHGGTTAT